MESNYDGPHVADPSGGGNPFSVEFVKDMVETFRNQKLIARCYLVMLLKKSFQHFKALPNLIEINLSQDDGRITVCGDTHGQFYDLLNIFKLNGFPSKENPYLFNGDFVDRGSFSLEVIVTLLGFKAACPESVYLLRGNHESKNMNQMYGFEGEVKHKYDASCMTMFQELFCWLPLCATIGGKVFVVHGGLSSHEGVLLKDIQKFNRNREPPDCGLMADLMWSDPSPFDGHTPSKRGVGISFGPNITHDFLSLNNLDILIRSHEVSCSSSSYIYSHFRMLPVP